jgi:hypothetical protein
MADVITIPDVGKNYFNDVRTSKVTPETLRIALYVNDVLVTDASVFIDFTLMTTHGIIAKDLLGASWPASLVTAGQAISQFAAQSFTATALDAGTATSVYGCILYTATSNKVVTIIDFDPVKVITNENDAIAVTPELRSGQKA